MSDSIETAPERIGTDAEGRALHWVLRAVCDVCGGNATCLRTASRSRGDSDELHRPHTVSRVIEETVYVCDEHADGVAADLCFRYGYSTSEYERNQLAERIMASVKITTE